MLLILKKYFRPDYSRGSLRWPSKEISHDFVRGQSLAETCFSHWGLLSLTCRLGTWRSRNLWVWDDPACPAAGSRVSGPYTLSPGRGGTPGRWWSHTRRSCWSSRWSAPRSAGRRTARRRRRTPAACRASGRCGQPITWNKHKIYEPLKYRIRIGYLIYYPLRKTIVVFDPLIAKLFKMNFHPLEVVSRWRDPQLQVSENYSDLTKWRTSVSNIADWCHILSWTF